MVQELRVLFLAAEAEPFVKVGGLADVAGGLPRALSRIGVDIRPCMPLHATIDRSQFSLDKLATVEIDRKGLALKATVYECIVNEVRFWLIDGDPVRAAPGVYGDVERDADKYAFTCVAALQACEALEWIPDIVHANDWHMAAAVMYLASVRRKGRVWRDTHSIYTIHNLPYMGAGAQPILGAYGLQPQSSPSVPEALLEMPMTQGILQADWISTVSPNYAREITTAEFGAGLDPLLLERHQHLSGILNGIDLDIWDPSTDRALAQPFNPSNIAARESNKRALQAKLGLELDPRIALVGLVTRLDHQKGVDLLWPALNGLSIDAWQLVLLGTGDDQLERICKEQAAEFHNRVRVVLQFDPELARLIYGGSDMLVIPSRYEPCGLTQMIAMRYGSVPIVRATGGLADTVLDVDHSDKGNGFIFKGYNPSELRVALNRALTCYQSPDRWQEIQRNGMQVDFSWAHAASAYQELYRQTSTLDVS